MMKIKKFGDQIDWAAKVVSAICLFAGCCTSICFIIVVFSVLLDNPGYMQLDEYSTITLGFVKLQPQLEYAAAYRTSGNTHTIRLMVGFLSLSILLFLYSYMAKTVRKIAKPLKESLPFDESVSKNMKKIGILVLVQGFLWEITEMYAEFTQFEAYDIAGLFDSQKIASCTLDYRFDLTFLFVALLFFGLSYIFQYGTQLQKFSDETI